MSAVLRNLMIPGRLNDPAEEEKRKLQERLMAELLRRNSAIPLGGTTAPADFAPQPLARDPSTLLTQPIDAPAPPPVDPLAGTEAVRNATYRPNPTLPSIPLTRTTPDPNAAPDVPLSPASPVPMTAPPTMIIRNDKGRPTGAVGDVLTRDQDLLEVQLGYKAPVSKKQLALQALFGFLNRGIPGAVASSLNYGLNQDYRNQQTMGGDIANTEGRIQRGVLQRKNENVLLNDQTERAYKLNQITRSNNPTYAPHIQTDEAGNLVSIQNGIATPIKDSQGNVVRAKRDRKYRQEGGVIYEETPDGLETVIDTRVDYNGIKGSPNAVIGARATEGREQDRITRENRKEAGSRASAEALASAADAAAADHQRKVNTASAQVSALQKQLTDMGVVSQDDPRRIILEQDMGRAQKTLESEQSALVAESQRAATARAEALKYSEPPLTRGTTPAPTSHAFSIAAYIAKNPGATEEDAKKFAASNYSGYKIVP